MWVNRKHPTHVVVDILDGYVFKNDSSGKLFNKSRAEWFARERNRERKPEAQSYYVYRLLLTRPYVVIDTEDGTSIGVPHPTLGTFPTEREAAEYIETLPDYETGRYALDGPE